MERGNKAGFFHPADIRGFLALSIGLLLGGCSHAARKEAPPSTPPISKAATIGVPACDAYLSRYLACHRAAGIYPTDTLQIHYQAMLLSLQQSAGDPQVRLYLANRCSGLNQQLNAALQGRSCPAQDALSPPPQSVSTTPTRAQN